MLKTLGTVLSVIGVFILGIATLVAGYWLGIIASIVMGALTVIAIVGSIVCVIVYTIIEAATMGDPPDGNNEDDRK